MQSKKKIVLAIQGDDAVRLVGTGLFSPGEWQLKKGPSGMPQVQINPTWEWIAISAIVATAGVAIAVILTLETLVVMGILNGYCIEIKQLTLGSVQIGGMQITFSLPTLALVLEPCS